MLTIELVLRLDRKTISETVIHILASLGICRPRLHVPDRADVAQQVGYGVAGFGVIGLACLLIIQAVTPVVALLTKQGVTQASPIYALIPAIFPLALQTIENIVSPSLFILPRILIWIDRLYATRKRQAILGVPLTAQIPDAHTTITPASIVVALLKIEMI